MHIFVEKNIKPHVTENIVGGKYNFNNPKPSYLVRKSPLNEIHLNLMKIYDTEYDELYKTIRCYSNSDTIKTFYNMHSIMKYERISYTNINAEENIFEYCTTYPK